MGRWTENKWGVRSTHLCGVDKHVYDGCGDRRISDSQHVQDCYVSLCVKCCIVSIYPPLFDPSRGVAAIEIIFEFETPCVVCN